jgi:hypothetical protein
VWAIAGVLLAVSVPTDQIHLSDRGATVVADLIADWLAPPAAKTQVSLHVAEEERR